MRAARDVPVVAVLAVDDHAAFLGAVVHATSGFEVAAEARSGEGALVAARCGPDLILVDDLPGSTAARSRGA
jgi:DNA-binding NarL/FixJ family response regulator